MTEVDTTAAQPTENVNTNQAPADAPAIGGDKSEGASAGAAPEITADQVAKFLGTNAETLEKFTKFTESNGSFDTAFAKLRKDVSTPAEKKEPEATNNPTEPESQQQPAQNGAQGDSPQQMEKGYLSPKDFALRQYFNAVANEPKYAAIKEDISRGKIFEEMAALGIKPTDAQGNYNDEKIHRFLDLKVATVPAQTNKPIEPSTTPTVQYTTVEGDISSAEQARKIIAESMAGRAKGSVDHPKYQEAKKFLAKELGFAKEEPKDKK